MHASTLISLVMKAAKMTRLLSKTRLDCVDDNDDVASRLPL